MQETLKQSLALEFKSKVKKTKKVKRNYSTYSSE